MGIDVGTSEVRVVVTERVKDKAHPVIIGTGHKESRGLRHGYIASFDEASQSIAEAIREAEKNSKTKISHALLSIGGISLGTAIGEASIAVSRADSEINKGDLDRVLSASEANLRDLANRKILHRIPLSYKVDGKRVLGGRPLGMKAGILEMRTLFITCLEQHEEDLIAAVEAAGVTVDEVIAAPIAESAINLTRLQKRAGCVLANIGAETVSIIVFEEETPVSLQVFQIGSMKITEDIALGLRISLEEAERIKKFRDEGNLRRKVDEIIEARLSDVFELIESHLKKIQKNGLLPAGIILSGGGSVIGGVTEVARANLKLPATLASSREIRDIAWSTAYGLCALEETPGESVPGTTALPEWLVKLIKNLMGWLKQFLP